MDCETVPDPAPCPPPSEAVSGPLSASSTRSGASDHPPIPGPTVVPGTWADPTQIPHAVAVAVARAVHEHNHGRRQPHSTSVYVDYADLSPQRRAYLLRGARIAVGALLDHLTHYPHPHHHDGATA